MIVRSAAELPKELDTPFHPDDIDGIYISWTDLLLGSEISSSTWILPAEWSIQSEVINGTIVVDGAEQTDVNGGLFSTTANSGKYRLSNQITAEGGIRLTRTVIVYVTECL